MININISRTSKTEKVDKEKIDEEKRYEELKWKYQLVINARNFHYENFNKWMTYFFIMISALIIGLCNILSKDKAGFFGDQRFIILGLCLLGFIISLAWHWANKGYYYWNINFISLVNHYEKNLLNFKENERVYLVFSNKVDQNNYASPIEGANISTSKISVLISYIFAVCWGFLICINLLVDTMKYEFLYYFCSLLFPIVLIYLLSFSLAKNHLFSYHKHFPDLELKFQEWKKSDRNI